MSISQKGSPAEGIIAAFDARRAGMRRWQLWDGRYRNLRATGSEALRRRDARGVSPR